MMRGEVLNKAQGKARMGTEFPGIQRDEGVDGNSSLLPGLRLLTEKTCRKQAGDQRTTANSKTIIEMARGSDSILERTTVDHINSTTCADNKSTTITRSA
ncbi:hypothetical protein VTN49DRAFT_2241 [Thermomyces lanuginosus]|uniref:uncharacterized protein n=1 Tax=Thermomyces lanuginosus TaxID=5541 RepID=UPI0037429A16